MHNGERKLTPWPQYQQLRLKPARRQQQAHRKSFSSAELPLSAQLPPLLSKFLAAEISSACSCLQLKSPITTITSTVPVVVGSPKHHSFELSRLSLQLTLLTPQVTTTTTLLATTTSTSTTVYTTSTSTTTTILTTIVDPFVCYPVGALCDPLAGQCCSGSCGTTDPNVPLHCCAVTSIPGGEQIDC
jgi:hypothetical protein